MPNLRLGAVRTIAFVASLLMGFPAFAAKPAVTVKSSSSAIDFFSPLKMPRYEQWKKLSPKAREEFIQDIQAFLLRADAMARSGNNKKSAREAQIIQRLFDLWIETAEANVKSKGQSKSKSSTTAQQQPYCINQGVVKPLNECNTKLGYKMHDFDTNEKLSPLGDASKCQAPEKPCSPFFGFTAEGQMFCSSMNLTRDCKQKSEQEGTISLASTLAACDKGSPGTPKVDCGKLKAFFDEQMSAVDQLCKDAPKRFACGILKDQIQTVMAEKEGKAPSASEASETQAPDSGASAASDADEGTVPDLANNVKNAIKMEANKGPCPPEQPAKPAPAAASAPASSVAPKPAAQTPAETACVTKPYPQNLATPDFVSLLRALFAGAASGTTCGEMTLPNQGKLKIDIANESMQFQSSANSQPIAMSTDALGVIINVSHELQNPSYKVAPKDLLAAYLPKEIIKDAGNITVPLKDKSTKEYPSDGWVSADGTRIRFAVDEKLGILVLSIKRPGAAQDTVTGLTLPKNPAAASQQKQ